MGARDVGSPGPGDLVDAGVPPGADARLRVAIAGDVGHPSPQLDATVAAMVRAAGPRRFDALVLLGDNVYPDGDPEQLDEAVLRPFAPVLALGTRLLPVIGNHDVRAGRVDVLVPGSECLGGGTPAAWATSCS